jgi:hypothetical protein
VLKALGSVDNDTNRQALAMMLVKFPTSPATIPAFRAAYDKFSDKTAEGLAAQGALAQAAAQFYDPSLTDWLLREIATAKGDNATALQLPALEAAIKLMTAGQQAGVGSVATSLDAQMAKIGSQDEKGTTKLLKGMYEGASAVLQKCAQSADCYVKVLDEPIPTGTQGANAKAIKAAWMSVIYGGGKDAVRNDLVARTDKVKNAGARLAVVEAIDKLAPSGDATSAGTLDKIVEADKPSGDKMLLQADDSVVKVALRLRARAM